MKLTRQTIKSLHALTDRVQKAEEYASELLRTAQDRYNHRKHKLTREGKKIELTEQIMWTEVFYAGYNCDSAEILKVEHPEVFAAYKEQEKAAGELQQFVNVEMGIDMKKMRISDYVKLTEALMDLKLSELDQGVDADGNVKSPIQDI